MYRLSKKAYLHENPHPNWAEYDVLTWRELMLDEILGVGPKRTKIKDTY
jgi:hypothetical protein